MGSISLPLSRRHIGQQRPRPARLTASSRAVTLFYAICMSFIATLPTIIHESNVVFVQAVDSSSHQHDGDTPFVHARQDGTITIHQQSFKVTPDILEACRHGNTDACKYEVTLKNVVLHAHSLHRAENARQQLEYGEIDALYQVIEHSSMLVENLLALALFHKEKMLSREPSSDEANVEFQKAISAYEGSLHYYSRIWTIMQSSSSGGEGSRRRTTQSLFSVYDQEAIASGIFGIEVHMSDMYHHRQNIQITMEGGESVDVNSDDFLIAYRHLISCEQWVETSMQLLAVDNIDEGDPYYEAHGEVVTASRESVAYIQLRIGTLLLDMYAVGYTLDSNDMLRFDPMVKRSVLELELDDAGKGNTNNQVRILIKALEKLHNGIGIYDQIERNSSQQSSAYSVPQFGDNRLNQADAHNHVGVAYQYLEEHQKAVAEWRKSLALYNDLFTEYVYNSAGSNELGIESITEVTTSLVTTTQNLWEELFILGEMSEATDVFEMHVNYRRFLEQRIPIEHPLMDDDTEYDEDGRTRVAYGNQAFDAGGDTLGSYQSMLEEYLQSKPDGSYYEMNIGIDGSSSHTLSNDKLYEGSLRSAIGSMYLAQNEVAKARVELELAVRLVREGLDEADIRGDLYELLDEMGRPVNYPARLYLGDALQNLALAQLGSRQWQSCLETFEEAMKIYEHHLPPDTSPLEFSAFGNASQDSSQGSVDGLAARLSRLLKWSTEGNEENGNGDQEAKDMSVDDMIEDDGDDENQSIHVEGFEWMENATANTG
eukprot:scaffold131_cov206-Alexandrium_tamarense.AAC.9